MRTCTTSRRRLRGATKAAGLRGVLGETVIDFPVADAKTPEDGLARAEAFIKEFRHDAADRARRGAARARTRSTATT